MMNEGSKAVGVGRARLYLTLIPEALVASILPPQAYPKFHMKPPFFGLFLPKFGIFLL
jgi:hypothetical protein